MKKPKLAIILGDALGDYDKKGYSREERNSYYNPQGNFDVTLLGFLEKGNKIFKYAKFQVYPFSENPSLLSDLTDLTELKHFNQLKLALSLINPDAVRGYGGSWAGRLAGEIGRFLKIPSVTSVHDLQPTDAILAVDRIFCVSEAVKEKCIEIGVNHSRIRILHDRVDTDLFKSYRDSPEIEVLRQRYPAKFRTVSAGRLVLEKNLERLIEATDIAGQELGDYTHIHFGEFGNLAEDIKRKARTVNFFNILPNCSQIELAKYFSLADAFVMTSLSEGCGMVYIEALACETPVITSNLPPMNTYVIDRYNGLLVDPRSPEDIATKIIEILTNRELYQRLKSNTRRSTKKFDSKGLQKEEARLYLELLNSSL